MVYSISTVGRIGSNCKQKKNEWKPITIWIKLNALKLIHFGKLQRK